MNDADRIDPVTQTVIDNFLTSTCRDMGVTMMKTSYSPIFNESLDFSCVIKHSGPNRFGWTPMDE